MPQNNPSLKQQQIEQALQLINPILWAITSKDEHSQGGLIATFVTNASIATQCPRFLIGIAKHHHTWSLINNSGSCALHLLSKEQTDLAWKLGSSSGKQIDKLADCQSTTWTTGSPIFTQAVAAFDCQVESQFDIGDRTLFLLDVVQGQQLKQENPLTFSDLWQNANQEQQNLMNRQLAEHQQIDQLAIQQWREQQNQTR